MKILEIAQKYNIELTKQGNLYVGFCVFHEDENRPNFTIYPQTDSYFCYTCSKGGDAVDLFAKLENIPRAQAQYRLYSDLQVLRDKINKVPEEVPYNSVINFQISKQFKIFLVNNPQLLSEAMKVMEDIDSRLVKDVSREAAINLVTEVNTRLKAIVKVYKI